MSKNEEQIEQEAIPAFVEELLANGFVDISSKEREGLSSIVDNIPADVKYGAGTVARDKETGIYSLRLVLIKS